MEVQDHRRLGRQLKIFANDEACGAGLPLWLPAGAAVREEIERFIIDLERRHGYQHVCYTRDGQTRAVRTLGPLGPLSRRHVPADGRPDRAIRLAANELPASHNHRLRTGERLPSVRPDRFVQLVSTVAETRSGGLGAEQRPVG